MGEKCKTCLGRLDWKTGIPCRYCKYNTAPYWGRDESKMTKDSYVYAPPRPVDSDIPY